MYIQAVKGASMAVSHLSGCAESGHRFFPGRACDRAVRYLRIETEAGE
jgi:ribosomal protein L32